MRHTENAVSLSAVPSEARSKRRTQNACSGTRVLNARVVYSSFWLQKPPNPFFAPCKKDPLCHIEFFNNFSKSSWDLTVNSTTIKFVEGQNLFLSEKKDPGRKPNLPHNPGEARTFFASAKKGSRVGKINSLVASTILSPQELSNSLSGRKRF